jgi:tetratricopeptide (TPR) repeat protein/SAM-dependent methyltransferase
MSQIESTAADVEQLFTEALTSHQAGSLDRAERLYEKVIEAAPRHFDSLNLLGVVALQTGRDALAVEYLQRALSVSEAVADAHKNIGEAYRRLGKVDLAIAHFGVAARLDPAFADAYERFRRLLAADGQSDDAIARYRKILSVEPNNAEAKTGLAGILALRGQPEEAARLYQEVCAAAPDFLPAQQGLARLMLSHGDANAALPVIIRALNIAPEPELKALFVEAVRGATDIPNNPDLRRFLTMAMAEPWARPAALADAATRLIKQTSVVANAIARITAPGGKEVTMADLFGAFGLDVLAKDELFRTLLETAPVCDGDIERLLGAIRFLLLQGKSETASPDPDRMRFYAAIARQNFINGYVFATTRIEKDTVAQAKAVLSGAIQNDAPFHPLLPVAIAAYEPLHLVAGIEKLLRRPGPPPVAALLTQQVAAPLAERELRSSIPVLTTIDDAVSLAVREQYEENPYPTWVKTKVSETALKIDERIRSLFPGSPFRPLGKPNPDILIAGCGTGQHSIETAQADPDARVLAVDLSLASLAYAKRKTREAGLKNLEYAQADILKLGECGRTFDVIESSGVLHHLREPLAGWRVLASLLRPGGLMRIGLYSQSARVHIRAARDFIARGGYQPTLDGIRAARQAILASRDEASRWVAKSPDFYTSSSCRDLLFHVQEHQFTLPQIKEFLAENRLVFLGFENLEAAVLAGYRRRFPADAALTDLDHWRDFEAEHPHLFGGMYQFWLQKAS